MQRVSSYGMLVCQQLWYACVPRGTKVLAFALPNSNASAEQLAFAVAGHLQGWSSQILSLLSNQSMNSFDFVVVTGLCLRLLRTGQLLQTLSRQQKQAIQQQNCVGCDDTANRSMCLHCQEQVSFASGLASAAKTSMQGVSNDNVLKYRGACKDCLLSLCSQMHVFDVHTAFAAAGQLQCWSSPVLSPL